jgi:hypothetical protein
LSAEARFSGSQRVGCVVAAKGDAGVIEGIPGPTANTRPLTIRRIEASVKAATRMDLLLIKQNSKNRIVGF